jgi:ABC-type phosphate/phosphonate transport system substrate-binding protein
MGARSLAGLLTSTFLAAALFGSEVASQPGSSLGVAVLLCTNVEASFRKVHPLFEYLESRTGFEMKLVVPADLPEFETMTRNGEVDFALQDPHTYERISHLYEDSSLLQTRGPDGSSFQAAAVIVRRDSGLRELWQLVGRMVMFGPRVSSPKWIAARLLFESAGIDVDRDLKSVNGGCCEDIAFTVMIRSVDAGVICDHFLDQNGAQHEDLGVQPDSLAVIGHTGPLPTRILAARKGVPPDVVGAITRALLDLDPANDAHTDILSRAGIGGFFRTTRADYLEGLGPSGAEDARKTILYRHDRGVPERESVHALEPRVGTARRPSGRAPGPSLLRVTGITR